MINQSSTAYRTHHCGQLGLPHVGEHVTLSGWIHRKRDHGRLLFIDLRDHHGITQCVLENHHESFDLLSQASLETVVQIQGHVVARDEKSTNAALSTGAIEVAIDAAFVLSKAEAIPFSVPGEPCSEDLRLTYRYLDLRRAQPHANIVLRSQVIRFIRDHMQAKGFLEIQTPILTGASPEGARDYVVPSRLYPGHFYALPQAPQQHKQLLMASGFDRYFQIAPCFRDEASRADRSPGEFYQLDMEMAFVNQEDVLQVIEGLLAALFSHFVPNHRVSTAPFVRLTHDEAMATYGSDKPDLRNPLMIQDWTESLTLTPFKALIDKGAHVRVLCVPDIAKQSRKFFKDLQDWAQMQGAPQGVGYIMHEADGQLSGPLMKFCDASQEDFLRRHLPMEAGVFFACQEPKAASVFLGALRQKLGQDLNLIPDHTFEFCWIVDFPMYERDEETGQIIFSHNPFSMPKGGMEALCTQDPLSIKAYQYDIVCNGIELSSGAIRNHLPDVMLKAFEIAGYSAKDVEQKFGALMQAFRHGTPPHGGSAPGIDRMVMLLAAEKNIREVIAFPLTQQARDLLMGAPSELNADHLKELNLSVILPKPTPHSK